MKLYELLKNIGNSINDPLFERFSEEFVIDVINKRIEYDIAPLVNIREVVSVNVIAGNNTVVIPDDVLIIISGKWEGSNGSSDVEIGAIGNNVFSSDTGIPRVGWIMIDKIQLHPTPSSSGVLKLYVIKKIGKLVLPQDELKVKDVDDMIILGTVYRLLLIDNNPLAEQWRRDYEEAKIKYLTNRLKQSQSSVIKDYWNKFNYEKNY